MQLWDLRTLKKTGDVEGAHLMPVRDFDFAHRREHLAVTAGDDCRLRYWDLRWVAVLCFSSDPHLTFCIRPIKSGLLV